MHCERSKIIVNVSAVMIIINKTVLHISAGYSSSVPQSLFPRWTPVLSIYKSNRTARTGREEHARRPTHRIVCALSKRVYFYRFGARFAPPGGTRGAVALDCQAQRGVGASVRINNMYCICIPKQIFLPVGSRNRSMAFVNVRNTVGLGLEGEADGRASLIEKVVKKR